MLLHYFALTRSAHTDTYHFDDTNHCSDGRFCDPFFKWMGLHPAIAGIRRKLSLTRKCGGIAISSHGRCILPADHGQVGDHGEEGCLRGRVLLVRCGSKISELLLLSSH